MHKINIISSIFDRFLVRKEMKIELTSEWLRKHFKEKYNITVGLYSYGCFDPSRIPENTTIGRYCSFAPGVRIFNANHGIDFISLHPYLYNKNLGCVSQETIIRTKCTVSDDVWIGAASIILPRVTNIGRGAVIAAGSVVTTNVPPYAIVAGNPAKVIRFRFSEEIIEGIERSKWWEMSKDDLQNSIRDDPLKIFNPKIYFSEQINNRQT